MRIPKFWARATRDGFEVPGWSFTSVAEAARVAESRLTQLIQNLTRERDDKGRYLYGDRPVREPIVETLGSEAQPDAIVTRNAYGALCLNTQDVAFVDVDAKDPGLLAKLAAKLRATDIKDTALDRIRQAAARHPDWGLRVYRTAAGFRVVAVHARISPSSSEAADLMTELDSDPLYRKLCALHDSFRARLTPKPWRIGVPRMPGVFPWRDAEVEQRVTSWIDQYESASTEHAVCELIETLGVDAHDPVIERVLAHHDQRTLGSAPLA